MRQLSDLCKLVIVHAPVRYSYDQKLAKYGRVAEQNNLRFIPLQFSLTLVKFMVSSKLSLKNKFDTS